MAWLGLSSAAAAAEAASGNASTGSPLPALPEVGLSVLRVASALAVVLALFLGGVWLFRNWQRLAVRRGSAPKLAVLETCSLGNRQALLVVGYERHRMLLAASPGSIALVAHLPDAEGEEMVNPPVPMASDQLTVWLMIFLRVSGLLALFPVFSAQKDTARCASGRPWVPRSRSS